MPNMPLLKLLDSARMHVEEDGVIPLDIAFDLMALGMDVQTLEHKMALEAGR